MKKIPMRTYVLFSTLIVLAVAYVYFFVYHEFRLYDSYTPLDPAKDVSKLEQVKELKPAYSEEELASGDSTLCQLVAKRQNTPVKILALLAKSEDVYVRRCVAANLSCTPEILAALVDDKDIFVRRLVVRHPATTFDNVYKIAQTKNSQIYWEVARSPLFNEKIWGLWDHEISTAVLFSVARNEACPPSILHELADREEFFIHLSIAQNKNTQKKTLEKLKNSGHSQITAIVEMRLKEQK